MVNLAIAWIIFLIPQLTICSLYHQLLFLIPLYPTNYLCIDTETLNEADDFVNILLEGYLTRQKNY